MLFRASRVRGEIFVGGSGLATVKSSEAAVEGEPCEGGALIGVHSVEGEHSRYDRFIRAFDQAETQGVVLDRGLDST